MSLIPSATILVFLLFLPISKQFEDFDVTGATDGELEEIKKYLSSQLRKIEKAIAITRKKRDVSPISASLPNRDSTGFLSRIGALKKSASEIIKVSQNIEVVNVTTTIAPSASENLDEPRTQLPSKFESGHFQHINDSLTECKRLSQPELVAELKQKGTYNPELMAWDAVGVIRFLDRSIHENYQHEASKNKPKTDQVIERNVAALEKLMRELNVSCDIRSSDLRQKLQNVTFAEPRRTILSPSLRRHKRMDSVNEFLRILNVTVPDENFSFHYDQPLTVENERVTMRQKLIGESHVVPFGCDKRGAEEDGYLRLCGACQAIRRLPDTFFPPFINEVTCDTDKACLYFYDYPHGKCRQKHMNFVVLRNVGTKECQIWKKFNLNVRVSCECFVDEMSFFAKYV
ncbi:unnamed protein product [Caenorhabditis bovis]|uniref:Spaetzle domain-containing protein n=1 Tax=Caenorhabditis bovis TaxID=2654633 RepID=A0A8S1ENC5_9PELO|nr:unnamed protein product [Caenorhabditis bovis]